MLADPLDLGVAHRLDAGRPETAEVPQHMLRGGVAGGDRIGVTGEQQRIEVFEHEPLGCQRPGHGFGKFVVQEASPSAAPCL